jgi:hypothetical protein
MLYSRFSLLDEEYPNDYVRTYIRELAIAVARCATTFDADIITFALNQASHQRLPCFFCSFFFSEGPDASESMESWVAQQPSTGFIS